MTHRSPITCVEHDPAQDRLFTGGYDGRVLGWHRHPSMAGPWVQSWSVQLDDLVNDVRLSPDGSRLAVAVADATVVVVDPADGRHELVLGPHGDDVNVVRWLPDGSGLVCVMDHLDPAVRLWRGKDGTCESRQLVGHQSGVFGAALDPAGRRLATAAEDGTARIWDLDSLNVLAVLAHPGDPEAIDWSPDGRWVVTGCDDKICRVWDPDRAVVVHELRHAAAAVRFVRFAADGARLLVGAYDATMRQYDTATWTVVAEHRHPWQWERAATFAGPDVVVAGFGGNPVVHP
ncbi:MAG: WD40 repeat domain-containing protein, partial [Acidimicrobiales bacterium]